MPTARPLFFSRAFAPLFLTQSLGALSANLFRTAALMALVWRPASREYDGAALASLATALYMLPFFLFSATAGRLADRMGKARLIRRIKEAEIACLIMAGIALYSGDPVVVLVVAFLVGAQTAFFGPLRYGILPDLLDRDSLLAGNGWIEAGQFTAVLAGSIAGTLSALSAPWVVPAALVGAALFGRLCATFIPSTPAQAPDLPLGANILAHTADALRPALNAVRLRRPIVAIAWGWATGAVIVTELPVFARTVLAVSEQTTALLLVAYTLGICAGAFLCVRVQRTAPSGRLAPFGAGLMALASLALSGSTAAAPLWQTAACFAAFGLGSSSFVVPFYAMLQREVAPAMRGRIMGASNIAVSLFITVVSVIASILLKATAGVETVFAVNAGANALVAAAVIGWWVRR